MKGACFIKGEWRAGKGGRALKNVNPANLDDIVSEFPEASSADLEDAVMTAQAAFEGWRRTPAPERGRVLWRAVEIAKRRHEEIARMLTREEGKIIKEARGEVTKGINCLEFFAGEGFRIEGKTLPSEARDTMTFTLRRPLGVVGLITPWNFPWAIPCWKVAPALVAGNTVVLKPSEVTPETAALLVEVFAEAGLPPGVLNLVVGRGEEVGRPLVEHTLVKAISFTGSNEVGFLLNETAARRGAKVTCEMGGKNAVIVMPDADLDRVIPAVYGGCFGSTGQRCTATSRLIVAGDVKGKLTEALVEKARAIRIGDGLRDDIDMGPVVDDNQFNTNLKYLDIGRQEGARVLTGGGKAGEAGNGYFVQPTIFDAVTPSMRIFKEEIFGPVLSICEAKSIEEALRMANDVAYGLTSSIFTRSIDNAMRYIEEVETGMVHVNEPTIGGEAQLPFGGMKATGLGEREMAQEGLNFFTELKTVFINFSGSGAHSSIR